MGDQPLRRPSKESDGAVINPAAPQENQGGGGGTTSEYGPEENASESCYFSKAIGCLSPT